jgi:hypothetical protein
VANWWPLRGVISGGQTGADIAGVKVGKALGYTTGGWMPEDWRTDEGPRPEYAEQYKMLVYPGDGYRERTRRNVLNSDGTVVFGDASSPGCSLTLHYLRLYHHPKLTVNFTEMELPNVWAVIRAWIIERHITTLNVAGNRERTQPGIEAKVTAILTEALKQPCCDC